MTNIEQVTNSSLIEHFLSMLKAKLAKLRRELITPKSQGGSAAQESFEVAKTGDARIGFVGFPSVGEMFSNSRDDQ